MYTGHKQKTYNTGGCCWETGGEGECPSCKKLLFKFVPFLIDKYIQRNRTLQHYTFFLEEAEKVLPHNREVRRNVIVEANFLS